MKLFWLACVPAGLLLVTSCGGTDGGDGTPAAPAATEVAAATAAPDDAGVPAAPTPVPLPTMSDKAVTTDSGLRYEDLTVGEGEPAAKDQLVSINYTGYLEDGTRFDSSVERGEPIKFQLGAAQVIPGWDEGCSGMKVGGKRLLAIPPDLAFGADGAPPVIPPNATLLFEVEMLGVEPAPVVPDKPAEVAEYTTTASGLQYAIVQPGDGGLAENEDTVAVHYTGWLEDGTLFDSSLKRGAPFEFTLGAQEVIQGWDEGVTGMRVGEKRQLKIPGKLGYGAAGSPPLIPANATLIFDVELLEIK